MTIRELEKAAEAKKAYDGLKEQAAIPIAAAREHWINACVCAIEAAQTLDEVIQCYRAAPPFTRAKARGLQRWVDLCETPAQLSRASRTGRHPHFLYQFFRHEGIEELLHPAEHKWMQITLPRIEAATNLEEIQAILIEGRTGFMGTQQFITAVAQRRASLVETEEDVELVLENHVRWGRDEVRRATKEALRERFRDMGKDLPWRLEIRNGWR